MRAETPVDLHIKLRYILAYLNQSLDGFPLLKIDSIKFYDLLFLSSSMKFCVRAGKEIFILNPKQSERV